MFQDSVVLVPWDFSACSGQALGFASQLTDNIYVLCVLGEPDPPAPGLIRGRVSKEVASKKCEDSFYEFIDERRYPNLSFNVSFGDPAAEIVQFASSIPANLILLPSHGRTGLRRVLLGSVAENVVRMASCPVMVLPREWLASSINTCE